MPRALGTAVDAVASDLASIGVVPPATWRSEVGAALSPLAIDDLDPSEPEDLIAAHFAFLGARLDDVTSMIFLQAMHDVLRDHARDMKPAFKRVGKNQYMTRIVVTRRLASRYFHEGRRRVSGKDTARSGLLLLERSRTLSEGIVDKDDRARPEVLRTTHSQIATACVHLARALERNDPGRGVLLRAGLQHSRAAEEHGDRTPDHDGYAMELALRLRELGLIDDFEAVEEPISRTVERRSATLQGLNGDVRFALAMDARKEADPERSVAHLQAAIDHYTRAIDLPHHEHGSDVGYLLAKRGKSSSLLYEEAPDAFGSRDAVRLERALADWLDPRSTPHRRDHEVARMLLARARLATASGEHEAAEADVAAATSLMANDEPPAPGGQLQRQTIEVALERAMDEADTERAAGLLAEAAALPNDAPVPSGAMSKTALWLMRHLGSPEWVEAVRSVLDRVEVDVLHPALSSAARGHVAGHAATLARVLARRSGAPGDLAHAVDLSREHLEAATNRSAAALDGASQAAFAFASLHHESSEAPSADREGSWFDAYAWALAALQTEQDIRTTVASRIDVAACALRMCEAAARLRDLSGDRAYTDAAAEALAIAEAVLADQGDQRPALLARCLDVLKVAEEAVERRSVQPSPTVVVTRRSRRGASRAAGPPSENSHARATAPQVDRAERDNDPAEPASDTSLGGVKDPVEMLGPRTRRQALEAWRLLAEADQEPGAAGADLRQRAAERFCSLTEATDRGLGGKNRGGRRGVTIVDDPTGLARQLVVLKRVDRATATREHDAIERLTRWRVERPTPPGWQIPRAVGVVEVDASDSVLVMRRSPGHTLASHLMEHLDGREPHPLRMFQQAASALADFHSALAERSAGRAEDPTRIVASAARRLVSTEHADSAKAEIAELLDTPQVPKKDAHAGNWIWSAAGGGLVMIDVEGSSTRPGLIELATILDDLPLLALDEAGWTTRLELSERYLSGLPAGKADLDGQLRHHLEAASLYVAVVGRARLRRHGRGVSSRGIRHARYQHDHYRDMTAHLAHSARSHRVREAAALLA